MSNAKIINAIFCDDVRTEDNGKFIIIGVWSNRFVVEGPRDSPIPKRVLGMYIEVEVSGPSKIEFELRNDKTGKSLYKFSGAVEVGNGNDELSPRKEILPIPISSKYIDFGESSKISLLAIIDDGPEKEINSFDFEINYI